MGVVTFLTNISAIWMSDSILSVVGGNLMAIPRGDPVAEAASPSFSSTTWDGTEEDGVAGIEEVEGVGQLLLFPQTRSDREA